MLSSRVLARWIPVIILALAPAFHTVVVGAASPAVSLMGFTPTATSVPPTSLPPTTPPPTTPPPTTVPPTTVPSYCIPVITKQCRVVRYEPDGAVEVIFSIRVTNQGEKAATGAVVTDDIHEDLEILTVTTTQGEVEIDGQRVTVEIGVIGPHHAVDIVIRTRVREGGSLAKNIDHSLTTQCVENLVEFTAYNCPDGDAAIICTLPETGEPRLWWAVVGGAGAVMLVLGLSLARRAQA